MQKRILGIGTIIGAVALIVVGAKIFAGDKTACKDGYELDIEHNRKALGANACKMVKE